MSPRVPAVAAVLGLAILLSAVAPALAHVGLASSDPAAGSTVERADTVTLVFDEALKASASSFKLTGPGGTTIGTGAVTGPRRMVLDAPGGLPAGVYTVKWTAAGTDGHIERGTFSFTVEASAATDAPAAATASPTSSPSPSDDASATGGAPATGAPAATGAPPASYSPSPMATPPPDAAAASSSGTDVLVPIVGGLAIVAVVGLLVLRRSRRR
jgi:copper resistance protein C